MRLALRLLAGVSATAGRVAGQEPIFTDANWVAFGTNFSAQTQLFYRMRSWY